MHEILFWIIASLTGFCAIATMVTQNIVRAATWLLFTLAGTAGIFFLLGADLVGVIQLLVYVGGTLVVVVFGVMLTAQGPLLSMRTSGAEYAASTVVGAVLMGVLVLAALSLRKSPEERYALSADYRLGMPLTAQEGTRTDPTTHPLVRYAPKDRLIKLTPRRVALLEEYEEKIEAELSEQRKAELAQERDQELARLAHQEPAASPYTNLIGQGLLGRPVGPAHEEKVKGSTRVVRTHYLFPFEIVSVHLLIVLIGAAYLARAKRRKVDEPVLGAEGEVRL